VGSLKDLSVYRKSYELCLAVYRVTANLPAEERFGLVSQMRRCAVSIPSNIAEGYRRRTRKEFASFLRVSLGSCSELETQFALSRDLGMLCGSEMDPVMALLSETTALLIGFLCSIDKRKMALPE